MSHLEANAQVISFKYIVVVSLVSVNAKYVNQARASMNMHMFCIQTSHLCGQDSNVHDSCGIF